MKILILVNALAAGGAERQAVQDANILFSLGHEVIFCCGAVGPLKQQLGRRIRLLDLQSPSQLKAIFKLSWFIRKNRVELVISHMFWANKVASGASFLTGTKNIAFEHGLGLWRKWHHKFLARLVALKATQVITCSEASRQIRIRRDKLPADKVRVLYNSFGASKDLQVLRPIAGKRCNKCFSIGFAGRFNKVKQLHLLIDVALRLAKYTKDFCFLLLGDGSERVFIEQLSREKGLAGHFKFTGYVPDPFPYLQEMDCFVLPSKREDFSLALLEASYCGLPCIAFDVGGNKELISDRETGWVVEPFDTTVIADRILELKQNPGQLKKMGKMARQRAENFFSSKQRGYRLLQLIQETVEKPL